MLKCIKRIYCVDCAFCLVEQGKRQVIYTCRCRKSKKYNKHVDPWNTCSQFEQRVCAICHIEGLKNPCPLLHGGGS